MHYFGISRHTQSMRACKVLTEYNCIVRTLSKCPILAKKHVTEKDLDRSKIWQQISDMLTYTLNLLLQKNELRPRVGPNFI